MLLDHMSGRASEIDAINGAIPPAAEALGRTAPYNEVISGLVRGKERRMGVRKS
jgi:2-dehydropantoate 2-reductase